MKRIGILTAGGDTPALNATIHGAVVRANQLRIEMYGLIKGFNCLFNPRVPHVHLNPLFQEIPELDPTKGGTLIGSSRDYVDPDKDVELDLITSRLTRLGVEGLIAIGGDGTLNGLQPLAARPHPTSCAATARAAPGERGSSTAPTHSRPAARGTGSGTAGAAGRWAPAGRCARWRGGGGLALRPR